MTWTNVVAGTLSVHVEDVSEQPTTKAKWREIANTLSVSLSALREALGAGQGMVLDPFGDAHPISLARWANHDPATRLLVGFSYQQSDAPEGFRGTIYPPDVLARVRPAPSAPR